MSEHTSPRVPAPKPAPREPSQFQRAIRALSFGFLSAGLQRSTPAPRPASSAPLQPAAPSPAREPRKGPQSAPAESARTVSTATTTAAAAALTSEAVAAAHAAGRNEGMAQGRQVEAARWVEVMTSPLGATRSAALVAEVMLGTTTAKDALSVVAKLPPAGTVSNPERQARNPNVGPGDWHSFPPPAASVARR